MKKVILSLLLLLLSIGSAFSQFDAQMSQYMFHTSSFNPAAVGNGDMIQTTLQLRPQQWIGFLHGGNTLNFSINSPLKIGNTKQGVGLTFLIDDVGLFNTQTAHLQYAFRKQLGSGVLSIGTDIGLVSLRFRGDSISKFTSDYHDFTGDPEIPQSALVGMSFDMNLGLYYSTPKWYTGISYLHLNSPTVNWGDHTQFRQTGSLFLTGGYKLSLPDTKYVFKPSTLIKTDFSSMQIDLTARVEYDTKYWGGLSYRLQDAVVFLAGINMAEGLSIGFSYDLSTSQISTVSWGTPEFLLMYSFEYVFGKRNNKYKSIRIL